MSTMDHSISSDQRVSQNPLIYKKFILAQANMASWTPDEHYKAMKLIDEMLEIEPNNYGVKKLQGWLLQQKVYLGLSENYFCGDCIIFHFSRINKLEKVSTNFN